VQRAVPLTTGEASRWSAWGLNHIQVSPVLKQQPHDARLAGTDGLQIDGKTILESDERLQTEVRRTLHVCAPHPMQIGHHPAATE
jgi:hypothetical protein